MNFFPYFRTAMKALPASSSDYVKLRGNAKDFLTTQDHDEDISKFENDEIAKDAPHASESRLFYRDDIPKATDHTFDEMVSANGMLVVLFYMNFDDKSFLLQPIFANVSKQAGTVFRFNQNFLNLTFSNYKKI